ncbi:putative glucosyl/glucuronosyl transferase [Cadophora sp. MPI-SDFR-AT-0126]|nr:putative glucosyl/glucuronosyl transferase [Leotiomycetes sp. MPI-SDFR-AT-0126]
MGAQPQNRSDMRTPVPDTVVHQSTIQQAQAAAAGQIDQLESARQALLQETDLATPDIAEDELPPPAYGTTYGEICDEKNGLGTSALITDDGRVNIRINQLNRRLSAVFTPALRQQVQNAQDSPAPPLPYIPPSLGGEKGVPPPPPLNVVIQVVGSRGDVQPFVALGKVLKETYGHRVRLATHPNFKDFVQENGLEFFSIGGDPSQLMAFMVKNPGLMPGFGSVLKGDIKQRRKDVGEYIQGCWRSCYKAGDGISLQLSDNEVLSESAGKGSRQDGAGKPFVADCIIANPPSFAHIHCAEKLGIPLHIMFTMPYSPTQAFPHPLANIQSSNADPHLTNYISYAMIEVLVWQGLGDIINRFRTKCLGLDPVSVIWAPGMLQRLKVPHTYCWSPALIPKPKDWGPHINISGFYLLGLASKYSPPPDLQAFLDAGPPPVYIGFGSIVLEDPNAMTELIFEAVRKTGQRVLLSKGWGGMGAEELRIPDGVFMLGNCPHDWLFQKVSCVVHHGGAGTTAAGITAGRPTVVVPFFGDQPFWGSMVARAGAGPSPIPQKQLTADRLADAISFCLRPESLERAKELANKISTERGSDVGAQSFHQFLDIERLRCSLAPSRTAAWRVRRTQIRLSPFAACTLANANLLDFKDLKLFRAREYIVDEGPTDPVSGFGTSTVGAILSMAMGVADLPSETWKALSMPFGSRQQSQASISTVVSNGESSRAMDSSSPVASPNRSQTSLNMPDSLRTTPTRPSPPARESVRGSNSTTETLQGQLSTKTSNTSSRQVLSRSDSSSVKDRDMLGQRGMSSDKGFGRIAKAALSSPMDISVSITEGFHNAPKIWGDDTVRPTQQVTDIKSGARAIGKEFAFGMYDGVTGLVTQPWKGAQKEGVTGFAKGIGRGIGGAFFKPGAALWGIPSYMMKGVHKEVQKMFGSNVQNYIVASRTAQGYEEWLQSSDEEKQDVIERWKLIQKYLKKKQNRDEMVRDVLETQRKRNAEGKEIHQSGSIASSAQSLNTDFDSYTLATNGSRSLHDLSTVADIDETIRQSVRDMSRGDAEEDSNMERAIREDVTRQQSQQHRAPDLQDNENDWREVLAASEADAQRHATERLEYERQLKQVMRESLSEHELRSGDNEAESSVDLYTDDSTTRPSENAPQYSGTVASSSRDVPQPPSYGTEHLTGTTQAEFEAQQRGRPGEKTAEEKTEEEIVLAYIKKQSLLEMEHRNKGKTPAAESEDGDDEELQKVLKLSLQGHEVEEEDLYGEPSRSSRR